MADQFIPIPGGEVCDGCKKEITGQYVKIGELPYHSDCFKCSKCDKSLAGVPYLQKDGKNFCQGCYDQTYGKFCDICKQIIKGPFVKVGDKPYHKDCFVCAECKQQFPGGQFYSLDNKAYCGKCLAKVKDLYCASCGKEIEGEHVIALERKWHGACFNCSKCKKPLSGAFVKENDRAVHAECAGSSQEKPAAAPAPAPAPPKEEHKAPPPPEPKRVETPPPPPPQKVEAQPPPPPAPVAAEPPKPVVIPDGKGPYYKLEQLQKPPYPAGVDERRRECYLTDEDFKSALGMTRQEFYAMPYWKQRQAKEKPKLRW